MRELDLILDQIKKRDKGKHTRIKMLKILLVLGPDFRSGDEIRKKYRQIFPKENFDFLYLEPLVYSYGLVEMKEKIKKIHFQKLAKTSLFRIKPEFYYILKNIFHQETNSQAPSKREKRCRV